MPTQHTTVKRHPERGAYDRATIDPILDEALICHLGFVVDGRPFVIPTIHARDGDILYIHGSPGSRMLRAAKDGVDICVTVTLVDGLVLARSVYNHSINYRSVVVLGRAREVTGRDEKLRAMQRVVDHVVPGRWNDARRPNEGEIKGTTILALPLDEAPRRFAAGLRQMTMPTSSCAVWAGVIPLGIEPAEPIADSGADGPPPAYAAEYERLT